MAEFFFLFILFLSKTNFFRCSIFFGFIFCVCFLLCEISRQEKKFKNYLNSKPHPKQKRILKCFYICLCVCLIILNDLFVDFDFIQEKNILFSSNHHYWLSKASHYRLKIKIFFSFKIFFVKRWLNSLGVMIFQSSSS